MKRLRKYLVIASQDVQSAMAYRGPFFISILAGLIQALVLYYIWRAVYSGRSELNGFTFSEMVSYVFISFAVRNLYGFYTEIGISNSIRDGSVVFELIKPLDFQLARFAESLGKVAVEGVMIGICVVFVGALLFGVGPPASVAAGALFLASLVASLLVTFALSFLVGLLSFWTTSAYGIVNAKRFVVGFFSGAVIPLAFFPDWLARITFALPFYTIVHTPVSIYLGKIGGGEVVPALLRQLIWAGILWIGGRFLFTRAIRRVTIHGG